MGALFPGISYLCLRAYLALKDPGDFNRGSGYLLDPLYQAIQGLAGALAGLAQVCMAGQIREEGIYFSKILTWDRLHGYRLEESLLLINTNKTKKSGKRKVKNGRYGEGAKIIALVRALEARSITEAAG